MNTKKLIGNHTVTSLSSILVTFGIYWQFIEPKLDAQINADIKAYIESPEYNDSFHKAKFLEFVKSPAFKEEIGIYITEIPVENSGISLTKALSIKLGIPENKIADVIVQLYNKVEGETKEKQWLRNLLRAVNAEHPDQNVWQTNIN